MYKKKSSRKFGEDFKMKAVQKVIKYNYSIEEVARKLAIHPFVLKFWILKSEEEDKKNNREIWPFWTWDQLEESVGRRLLIRVRDPETLLNRYILNLWRNEYFNRSEKFRLDPEIVDAEGLRSFLLKNITSKYSREYPELDQLVTELRQSYGSKRGVKTPEQIYDRFKNKLKSEAKLRRTKEKQEIKNLSLTKVINDLIKCYEIKLDKRRIDIFTEYYLKIQDMYNSKVKGLSENDAQKFLFERMLDWIDRLSENGHAYYKRSEHEYAISSTNEYQTYKSLTQQFNKIYDNLLHANPDWLYHNLYPDIGIIICAMIKFLNQWEDYLEFIFEVQEYKFSRGRPSSTDERSVIAKAYSMLKENELHSKPKLISISKNAWLADFFNLLSNIITWEWQILRNPYIFPFGNYTARKIEKALEITRNK